MRRPPPRSTLFPYTTLFRSVAHEVKVTTGIRSAGRTQITSGLAGGETVVTQGNYGLPDGTKVAPMPLIRPSGTFSPQARRRALAIHLARAPRPAKRGEGGRRPGEGPA